MENSIRIISLNCQGLCGTPKRRDVFHYLRQKNISVAFLQDTHIESKLEQYVAAEWGYQAFFSSHTSNSRGVAVLFNNTFEFKISKVIKGEDGNSLIIVVKINGYNFTFVNIYGPNRDDPDFYCKIKEKITNLENIIMAGDFNLVLDPSRDYHNYKHVNNPRARQAVDDMTQELDLSDIWRELNPNCLRYTWRRTNPFQQSRLDFFLISDTILTLVDDADITCGYRSDHSMITLNLKFSEEKQKRNTMWKLNSSLLKEKKYVDEINQLISDVVSEYAALPYSRENINEIPLSEVQLVVSEEIFLDFLLMKVRSKTIAYASMKKRKTNEEEQNLIKEIETLEATRQNQDDSAIIEEKQSRLQVIREKRMEGVLLRSRARYIAEGEKVTKYFCNMEKRNFVSKTMSRLVNQEGNTLTKHEDVIHEVKSFYENLYKSKEVEHCEISELVNEIPRLSEDEARSLEGEITLDEAAKALKNMKNSKSPGSDGFTAEFFKVFWRRIGHFVIRALNFAFRKGELSNVQKEGIITCIPKGDKPREFIKNWRPISLLNVVYKIGSSCIANRMKTVLSKLINDDQTGFMSGRYIGDNLRLIYDLIAYLNKHNLPGMLINIDFEKAFDSLDWGFMFKVLEAFGFKEDMCKWISTFYSNIKSTVLVNGNISQWFSINRGCRQGDPISPYLFILCVEILAIMTRENKDIKGIFINDVEHKLSQYADDTEFILEGDKKSFETCIEVIIRFGKRSGLFMNSGKTSVIWLGSKKNSDVRYLQHLGMEWNPHKFRVLGVWFTNDLNNCENINYAEKFAETKKLFQAWMKRCITPLGRIAILKSLILSKLIHLWLLLPNPPEDFMDNLQKICYTFVWNDKQDKISRKTTHKSVKEGGLGLPNLKSFVQALKLTWIRKFSQTNHKWKNIASQNYPFLRQIECFGPNITTLYNKHNSFWTQVFNAYTTLFYKIYPQNSMELLAEPLCFNERIKIGGNTITQNKWFESGVNCIGHFVQDNGEFMRYEEFIQKYNINVNFLTYNGCRQALRAYTRSSGLQILDNRNDDTNVCLKKLLACSKGCKQLYDILMKNNERPNCCTKWEQKLNQNINWEKCFLNVQKTNEVNMKWFQIRIIHRIIGTNIVLKQMGVTTSENCGLCGTEKDSIEHIFWHCGVSQNFWTEFVNLVNEKCPNAHNMRLSKCLVLLGHDDTIMIDSMFSFILLLAKQYIYKCKLDYSQPNMDVFRKKLLSRYRIEEFNSKLTFSHQAFTVKWLMYRDLCACTM